MKVRYFALIAGSIALMMGLLGFIPGLIPLPADAPAMGIDNFYGYLFGLFPTNILHNLLRIAIGAWGIASFRNYTDSKKYAQAFGVAYTLLAIMGIIPGFNTMFGLMPIFGNDVLFSAICALAGVYFGFKSPAIDTNENQIRDQKHLFVR